MARFILGRTVSDRANLVLEVYLNFLKELLLGLGVFVSRTRLLLESHDLEEISGQLERLQEVLGHCFLGLVDVFELVEPLKENVGK